MEIVVKKILIPVGEYTDPTPLLRLVDMIKGFKSADITLFGVVTVPFTTSLEQEEIKETDRYKRIKIKLDDVRNFFKSINISVRYRIVLSRDIPEAIIEESLTEEYDLIVLVKRLKPSRFIRKSVSQAVLSKIPRPLLILTMG